MLELRDGMNKCEETEREGGERSESSFCGKEL
jgi:hypothetical protein